MSKPKIYQFMGSKEDQKPNKVKVAYDPSIIKKSKKKTTEPKPNNESLGNSMANMGLASSLGKDERLFQLETKFDQGQIYTVSSAANLLQVTYQTAKKYAKELKIALFDDQNKKWLNGRRPKIHK